MTDTTISKSGLVINLHFTDVCNYHCRFCHSRFGTAPLTFADWKKIIGNITGAVRVKRFNLAGGEPMTAPYLQELIDHIHSLGIDCSIITNGTFLTKEFIHRNRGKLSMIGISMDAVSTEDNLVLGRATASGRTLSPEFLITMAEEIHSAGIRLKINTVVNRVNWDKDFAPMISVLRPDRWKLLRMIRIKGANDKGNDLLITDAEYRSFAERHSQFCPVVEDTADIVNAYIVVNPHGQLLNNSDEHYQIGKSLLESDFSEEFRKINFNPAAYQKRYQK